MCSSLVVALGLLTVSAPPQTGYAPNSVVQVRTAATYSPRVAQVAEPVPAGEVQAAPQEATAHDDAGFSYGFSSPGGPMYGNGGCNTCRSGDGVSGLPCCFDSTCNLFPHVPYYVEPKTYYYFRPYNHNHVFLQRDQVMRWGGDPRNPYANEVFQQVYRDLDGEAAEPGAPSAAPITPNAAPITPNAAPTAPGDAPAESPPRGAQIPTNIQISATSEVEAPLAERMVLFLDNALSK